MKICLNILINGHITAKWVFAFYLLITGVFYLQLPLHQSLPGNWDNWLYLSLFNYYPDYFNGLLTNTEVYKPFFPDSYPPFMYGDPSFFNSFIYIPAQYILRSPIWSFYVFTCIVMSLNGLGMYLLTKEVSKKKTTAVIAGLLLMFSNYMLSSLDQPNVFSIYPSLFSIYNLLLFHKTRKNRYIYIAVFWWAIQIYCSGYNFLFCSITIAVLFLFYVKEYMNREGIVMLLKVILILMLLITPYAYLYVFSGLNTMAVNPVTDHVLNDLSLHLKDFFIAHPYNIVYGIHQDESILHYLHSILMGLCMTILFFGGFYKSKYRLLLAAIIVVFALIFTGPECGVFPNPLYIFMKSIGLDQLMRTPVRGFIVVLVIVCLLSAQMLKYILEKSLYIGILILILVAIENIPFKLQYFPSWQFVSPPKKLLSIASQLKKGEIIWIHPSKLYESNEVLSSGLGQVNREYIYMYWQTLFKKSMANGMNGYVPLRNLKIRKGQQNVDSIQQGSKFFKIKHIYLEGMNYPGEIED